MICAAALWCTGRAVLDSDCAGIERLDCVNGGGVSGEAGLLGFGGDPVGVRSVAVGDGFGARFGVKAPFGNARGA